MFIYGRDLNGAMHEDKVLVRIMQLSYGQARAEGEVVRVLERAHAELVGTLTRGNRVWQVIPDDERQIYPVIIKEDPSQQWAEGSKVLVRITGWPRKFSYPEVFGRFTFLKTFVNRFAKHAQNQVDRFLTRSEERV